MIVEVEPVVSPPIQSLCTRPYPGHPHGCPNYGRKQGCPPKPLWNYGSCYAIITGFDLAGHVEKMRQKHPDWSPRQLVCCLYWQGTARKNLKAEIVKFMRSHPGYKVDPTPEASGVNVTATLKAVGIELEWPPVKIARQVALAYRDEGRNQGSLFTEEDEHERG